MEWTIGTYKNGYDEERKKWESSFYKGQTRHTLTIKEYGKGLFCICFDSIDICGFDSLEEAKSFGLGFRKGFGYCKDEMLREINTYFNL